MLNERRDTLEFLVVCPAASGVNETASDTGDEKLVRDDELDYRVELLFAGLEHGVKLLSLRDCAREAVEDEATKGQTVSCIFRQYNPQHLSTRDAGSTPLRGIPDMDKGTHPFLQALLFSSWSLIMPTMMSSLTSPPASMIFFASCPSWVCFWTCSRSMSPVARWQTQNSSRMRGACVPLPDAYLVNTRPRTHNSKRKTPTGTRRTDQNGPKLLGGRLRGRDRRLCLLLEALDFLVELCDERLEVLEFIGGCHGKQRNERWWWAAGKRGWRARRGLQRTTRRTRRTPHLRRSRNIPFGPEVAGRTIT